MTIISLPCAQNAFVEREQVGRVLLKASACYWLVTAPIGEPYWFRGSSVMCEETNTEEAPGLNPNFFTFHVPVNERQSVETLELSPPLFQQRHIIQTWWRWRCPAPTLLLLLLPPPLWTFGGETRKCRRPTNASLCPLFNWPRAVRLSPVPSLTVWMCQHSFPFKSMRPTLRAGNGTVCRPDSNLTDTWTFSCWLTLTHLLDKISVSLYTRSGPDWPCGGWPPAVSEGDGDTPCVWLPWISDAAFKVQLRKTLWHTSWTK